MIRWICIALAILPLSLMAAASFDPLAMDAPVNEEFPAAVKELVIEMDDQSELVVNRSWTAGVVSEPKPRDLTERLVVVRDGKRVSVQNQEIWQKVF